MKEKKEGGDIYYSKTALEEKQKEERRIAEEKRIAEEEKRNAAVKRFRILKDTIVDTATGNEWPKDAGSPTVGNCKGDAMNWDEAKEYINCLNSINYLGHNDWLLPDKETLVSFAKAKGEAKPEEWFKALGCRNVKNSSYYWSATTHADYTGYAWVVYMWSGNVHGYSKSYYGTYTHGLRLARACWTVGYLAIWQFGGAGGLPPAVL
ncbi:protein of unknown function DUF1566 [Candidatus Magnetoovum chiemensis]|nr:protein of unknown function DUF1566 [Candidatus Magnetoovum chiemensis]